MHHSIGPRILLTAGLVCAGGGGAEDLPPIWGYGVKPCDDYARVWTAAERGVAEDIGELRRYEDWLAGIVTGLNLATGRDVLAGSDPQGALRRIHLYCDEHRKADFFAATMDLIKQLSVLR